MPSAGVLDAMARTSHWRLSSLRPLTPRHDPLASEALALHPVAVAEEPNQGNAGDEAADVREEGDAACLHRLHA